MKIDNVWGIGRMWKKKLNRLGIKSVGDFTSLPNQTVKSLLNVNGLRTKMELEGIYCHEVKRRTKIKKHLALLDLLDRMLMTSIRLVRHVQLH